MKPLNPIFSDYSYYENKTFVNLMREWNKTFDINNCLIRDDYQEVVKFDFLMEARHWLKIYKKATWWRKGLE